MPGHWCKWANRKPLEAKQLRNYACVRVAYVVFEYSGPWWLTENRTMEHVIVYIVLSVLHNCVIFTDFTHTKTYISYFHHNIRTGPSFLKIRNEGPQGKPKYAKVKPTWAPQWGADFSAQSANGKCIISKQTFFEWMKFPKFAGMNMSSHGWQGGGDPKYSNEVQ